MNPRVSSYNRDVRIPSPGGLWVWEARDPASRALIEVVQVEWNGEEWFVRARVQNCGGQLPFAVAQLMPATGDEHTNDLSRFFEASTPVGGGYIAMTRKVSAPRTGGRVYN